MIRADAFQASVANKVITIPGIRLSFLDKGLFHCSGHGRIGGPLDFSVRGTIPAEVIQIYTDEYKDITGNILLTGFIQGTFADPVVRGSITLENIGATITGLMQTFHDVNGTVAVSSQAVSTDKIQGMLDQGEFRVSGKMALKKLKPDYLEARFLTTALPVVVPDSMEFLLNTDISVKGTSEKSVVEGSLTILEGRYFKNADITLIGSMGLIESMGKKNRMVSPVKKEIRLPFLAEPELKLKIKTRVPLDIDNNIAVMTLRPDLTIYGTLNNPLISGRADVPSGVIIYQNKDFLITKGVVDFINPYKIEPAIDINGQMDIRKWTIYLKVSGKPDNLNFRLTSDPQEEHWDILSLVAFGKTTVELSGNAGGTAGVSPRQRIADMVAKSLQENIRSETSFDSIEMKYTEGTASGSSGDIKLTVGKELAERLSIKYGVETQNGVTVQSAETEYKFLESILMKAFHDTEGDFGGELVFRLEFR
jgi:translocation and assembly module TamB